MGNLKKLFGKNMRFIRKAKGMTQEKLGELININQRQLTRIECGKNFPSADTLEKICYYLDVPIKQLFDFKLEEEEMQLTGTDNYFTYKAVKFGNVVKLELVNKNEKVRNIAQNDNKQIDSTESDLEMLRIAKKSGKPVTVEYLENGETSRITIYFPDGTYKHIRDNRIEKTNKLNEIYDLLKTISDQPKRLQFVELAINALEDRAALEKLKAIIEGIELLK